MSWRLWGFDFVGIKDPGMTFEACVWCLTQHCTGAMGRGTAIQIGHEHDSTERCPGKSSQDSATVACPEGGTGLGHRIWSFIAKHTEMSGNEAGTGHDCGCTICYLGQWTCTNVDYKVDHGDTLQSLGVIKLYGEPHP